MQLFSLMGKIAIEGADEAKREIDGVNDSAERTSSTLGGALGGIGNTALAIGKAVAVGVGASATAIIATTKQAIGAYGNYEQLLGGVKTLYGDTWETVLANAQNAYSTAGISANQYMEQVTSFTASLLQSLEKDTAKTAEIADMAIQDMSDNANKMGTSMEMIQNAYQGFSKQNYTMLDNLKLGYGGTKEEMARLLADAEKLPNALGRKFDMSNLSDVYTAIHLIQEDLGITGATAEEALTTIQGTMKSVGASWQNVLVGLADGNQNLGNLIQVFIDNLRVMLENMIPTIQTIFSKIPSLITSLAPLLGEMIISLVPNLLDAVWKLIQQLVGAIPSLWGEFTTLFTSLADFMQTNIPIITAKATEMMAQFGEKIRENIPSVLSKALELLTNFSQTLLQNAPQLVYSGMELLVQLAKGIADQMPLLIQKVPQIVINIANTISASMQTILLKGAEIVWELIKGIIGAIPTLIQEFPKVIEAIFSVWNAINWLNLGTSLMNGISNGIKNMGGTLKQTASNVFNNFKTSVQNIFTRIGEIIKSPILSAKTRVLALIGELQSGAVSVFRGLLGNVTNIFNAVKTAITSPISSARDIIKGILNTIKGFFSGFKISIPKIPMPHFSISPSGWGIGDLLKGRIPRLGISWYKKAMDDGMILDSPQIFGYQNGNFLAGGEAGSETVVGTESLMRMIQRAVDTNNARNEELLEKILSLLAQYIPNLNLNPQLVLDTGVLVSELAPKMDRELGVISRMKERGR